MNFLPPSFTREVPRILQRAAIRRHAAGFTLIELLVVISVIAILAALAFPAVNGAIKSARKADVRSMAGQIKGAISTYYAEYGVFPTNVPTFTTDTAFLTTITGQNANNNRRMVRFMEVPSKFTNSTGIVTPLKFYRNGQANFNVVLDTDYDGMITVPGNPPINATVAVYVNDPDDPSPAKVIGTWK